MRIDDALNGPVDRTDAEILLAALLDRDRSWVVAHGGTDLAPGDEARWAEWQSRRMAGEPVAYITGRREFYGRSMRVDRRALIPRPATESLVGAALDALLRPEDRLLGIDDGIVACTLLLKPDLRPAFAADVGTGSGCIAITLALERPGLPVIATDASTEAMALARENAASHGVLRSIDFREGPLLDPLAHQREPFLLVSNPPYVPDGFELPRNIDAFEPAVALRAGPRGLDVLLPLVAAAGRHPACVACVLECRADQVAAVAAAASRG